MPQPETRLLLLHKQATSARVRFLCGAEGVVAFAPLPAHARLCTLAAAPAIHAHPAAALRDAVERLGLPPDALVAEAGFHAWASTPDGPILVLLAVFTTTDPPFAAAERIGARFIAITEARALPAIERDLLGRAYEHVMG